MTAPTAQEAVQELDEILRDAIYVARYGDKTARQRLAEAKVAIASYTAKQVLEARIEELVDMYYSHWSDDEVPIFNQVTAGDIEKRLKELQQARKDLGGEK